MKGGKKNKDKAYLTTRILKRVSRKATNDAAKRAMEIAGYIITVREGRVVKEYKDGTIEEISTIDNSSDSQEVILD